ncbi:MAG: hypothetical protein ACRDU9_05650 [Acidimicrobiia bacterium]
MRRTGRNSLLLLVSAVLVASLSMSVMAAEEGGEEGGEGVESTTTTIQSGLTPAVPIEDPETAPATADWTYRYMIPTALVLAVLIIIVTAVKYFTDVVRKRYRIIEE